MTYSDKAWWVSVKSSSGSKHSIDYTVRNISHSIIFFSRYRYPQTSSTLEFSHDIPLFSSPLTLFPLLFSHPILSPLISHYPLSSSVTLSLFLFSHHIIDRDWSMWILPMCAPSWVTLARLSWASEGGQVTGLLSPLSPLIWCPSTWRDIMWWIDVWRTNQPTTTLSALWITDCNIIPRQVSSTRGCSSCDIFTSSGLPHRKSMWCSAVRWW